jgi:hypothetical protein
LRDRSRDVPVTVTATISDRVRDSKRQRERARARARDKKTRVVYLVTDLVDRDHYHPPPRTGRGCHGKGGRMRQVAPHHRRTSCSKGITLSDRVLTVSPSGRVVKVSPSLIV